MSSQETNRRHEYIIGHLVELQDIWRKTKHLFDYVKRVKVVIQQESGASYPNAVPPRESESENRRAANH